MFESTSYQKAAADVLVPKANGNAVSLDAFQDSPLFAPRTTAAGMASYVPQQGANLYFGTGLATTKALTRGFPFDLLGMVVGAETVRQTLGFKTVIHEISDTHAIGNGFAGSEKIPELATQQRALIATMVKNLNLQGKYDCVLASERLNDPAYQRTLALVQTMRPDDNHYFTQQWAGMSWLASERGVCVKVGWLTDDKPGEARGFDERRFDSGYDQLALEKLNYVYLKNGRNFDSNRSRVSPYTSVEGEDRIMLRAGEDAKPYFERMALQQAPSKDTRITITHLANVVTAFESLFGKIEGVGETWLRGRENLTQGIILPTPQAPELAINLPVLAEKINGILSSVFELRPSAPAVRLSSTSLVQTAKVAAYG